MFACDGRTVLSDLFYDGISASGHDTGSINSSGVQMIGDTSPARRHASSIFPRIAALARCRRFQVRRKSTPFTAAIATRAASTRAVDGKAPLRRGERTSVPARGPATKIAMPGSALMRRAAAGGQRKDFVWWDVFPIPAGRNNTLSHVYDEGAVPGGGPRHRAVRQQHVHRDDSGLLQDAHPLFGFHRPVRPALPHPGARGPGHDAVGPSGSQHDDLWASVMGVKRTELAGGDIAGVGMGRRVLLIGFRHRPAAAVPEARNRHADER